SGRQVEFSIGYRNSDGAFGKSASGDDAYHYSVNIYRPFKKLWAWEASGRVYNRDGPIMVQPDISNIREQRHRFDRNFRVGVRRHNDDQTASNGLYFRHHRESSNLSGPYSVKLNRKGYSLKATRQVLSGKRMYKAIIEGDYKRFDDQGVTASRHSGKASVSIADLTEGWHYSLRTGVHWVEMHGALPLAALMLTRQSKLALFVISAGYSQRAPSLYEIYLSPRSGTLYNIGANNYSDRGNRSLEPEKQLTGTALMRLGGKRLAAEVTITGGQLRDGIDWIPEIVDDPGLVKSADFVPRNGNVEFADIALRPSLSITDFFRLLAGGSYHWVTYDNFETRPYTPEYQAFAGGEIHLSWPQKQIELYGYSEVTYTGPYVGYFQAQTGLGEDPIINAKASFRMGNFRFHFLWQNVLNRIYQSREDFSYLGRFTSYGFVWDFLN
ncbi:MAG: TonB-dependent receptor, partial [candidate division Zixibacteria bacterium]